ncbi:MAG: SH3 domain-containing protein [Peptostreptococcaceae bacterium]
MVKKYIATLGIGAVAVSMNFIEADAMEKGIVTASALNIRSGPSTSDSVIGKINKGQPLEVLEKGNSWYKVKLQNGTVGWASSQYISFQENSNSSSSQVIDKKGTVKASTLNVRSGAGTNYSVITKLSNGAVVNLVEKSNNGWYKVKLSNGSTGWVSCSYILENVSSNSSTPSDNQQPTVNVEGKKAKVNANSLNVRSGAGTSYSVVTKVSNGTIVNLVEKSSNGWYKIKLSNGTVGWASGSYLVETIESSNDTSSQTPPTSEKPQVNENPSASTNKENVINFAYSLLGKPYEWGASGPNSFDCSGFTQYVYKTAEGKSIPRVSRDQAKYGQEVTKGNYMPGDLLYFDTDGDGSVNHVGIYLGSNEFIHSSGTSSKPDKVKITNLNTTYWTNALKGARRF